VDEKSVTDFIEQIETLLAQGEGGVVVDCSPLERVTSSHINGLWLAHEACESQKAKLELENVREGLRRVLDALNLSSIFLKKSPLSAGLKLKVHPSTENIDLMMSKVVNHLTASGLPEITAFELQTIFYEIATNIRLHSGLRPTDSFAVTVGLGERQVTLTFTDPGAEFDPTAQNNECDIQEAGRQLRRRGFGLAMVEGLCNTLSYTRTSDQQNQLVITKKW
jgi:anti-sigma regulatory factor (Ser/Thr protein kinase)/ABC-type transporter Mla MlaB component